MKISIVIPAYNEEREIAGCLTAVQTEMARFEVERPNIAVEVVVVNNASTDRTEEIAVQMGVRVVNELRKGMVRARAAGFAATDGDLVANIDADTRMPPKWLTRVSSEFERDPKLVALSGPYIYYDLQLWRRALIKLFYLPAYSIGLMGRLGWGFGAVLQGGNFILRRQAWESVGGFDTTIEFYGEDTDVARRIAKAGKVKWTWKLPMMTSGRRLMHEGMVRTAMRYTLNFFSMTFFGRAATQEYTDIRPK